VKTRGCVSALVREDYATFAFVIEHYYPQCQGAQKYVDFFNQVVKRTAKMLADWPLAWQWNKDIRE
jgi:uncharacterized protein YdiU (UPF0061 family)